jgi:hypothetical protein
MEAKQMTIRYPAAGLRVICVLIVTIVTGCQVLHYAGVPGLESYVDPGKREREEAEHREEYQLDQDPDALNWLLTNRVATGMSRRDIGKVLGQEGERQFDDRQFKSNGSQLRVSDRIYRWGPDSDGRSIYLGFRDGKLVNFDSSELNPKEVEPSDLLN